MIRIFPYINVLVISQSKYYCQKQLKQAVKDQQFKIHIDDSSRRKRKKLEVVNLLLIVLYYEIRSVFKWQLEQPTCIEVVDW